MFCLCHFLGFAVNFAVIPPGQVLVTISPLGTLVAEVPTRYVHFENQQEKGGHSYDLQGHLSGRSNLKNNKLYFTIFLGHFAVGKLKRCYQQNRFANNLTERTKERTNEPSNSRTKERKKERMCYLWCFLFCCCCCRFLVISLAIFSGSCLK